MAPDEVVTTTDDVNNNSVPVKKEEATTDVDDVVSDDVSRVTSPKLSSGDDMMTSLQDTIACVEAIKEKIELTNVSSKPLTSTEKFYRYSNVKALTYKSPLRNLTLTRPDFFRPKI